MMNSLLKLINFEFNRFFKYYLVLIVLTIVLQIGAVVYESFWFLHLINELMFANQLTQEDAVNTYGYFSFTSNVLQNMAYIGSIFLCIVTLLLYMFFIWYRDWFGKNTFIYRLLILPSPRIHVYLAKAVTIVLAVLGLIALQILLIPIEIQIMEWIVPKEFRIDLTVKQITNTYFFAMLIPNTFTEFLLIYGLGILAVFVIFNGILFERAYRLKGVIYGLLFSLASVTVFLLPILVHSFILVNFLFPNELLIVQLIFSFIVIVGVIATGNYLIKYKVRV